MEIQQVKWKGMDAAVLSGAGYRATILPAYGANCVSLVYLPAGKELLRVPETEAQMAAAPNLYGLPILFPPNRIRDGRFFFGGREYTFPLNEPEQRNHIHGFLSATPFAQTGDGLFEYRATEKNPYMSFSHSFSVRRRYCPGPEGLFHTVEVTNESGEDMPVGTGIHATLRAEGCRLRAEAVRRWPVDPTRHLPSGETETNSPLLEALRAGTLDPCGGPVSALLECRPGSEIVLTGEDGGAWHCVPDGGFRFIMLWNGDGKSGFVCPEPQSWMTDAPNLALTPETTGFRTLAPGETARFSVRYYYTRGGKANGNYEQPGDGLSSGER